MIDKLGNLSAKELRSWTLQHEDHRERKKPRRYSPSVERMLDDRSSDWSGVSLDEFDEEEEDQEGKEGQEGQDKEEEEEEEHDPEL